MPEIEIPAVTPTKRYWKYIRHDDLCIVNVYLSKEKHQTQPIKVTIVVSDS